MGLISRLLGKESETVTARVDDFLKAGSSVKSKETRSTVAQISQTLRDIDFEDLVIEFTGQDTSSPNGRLSTIGRKVTGAELSRQTLAGVFTDDSVKAFGITGTPGIAGGIAHHSAAVQGTPRHLEMIQFFESQGITVENPNEVKSFLFFSDESITKSMPDNLLLVGHETRTRCWQYIWS